MTDNQNTTAAQPLDLDKLEALARAATPGPWKRSNRPNGPFWHISSEYTIGGEPCKSGRQSIGAIHAENKRGAPKYAAMFEANANFVAEFNPATALALIAQARAAQPESTTGTTGTDELRTAAAELLKYLDDHDWGGIPEGATADRLRAALARNSHKLSEQSSYDAQGVKPWRERLYMGYDECDKHEAMEAEIADLRAQLAANGQGEPCLYARKWELEAEALTSKHSLIVSREVDGDWSVPLYLHAPASAQPAEGTAKRMRDLAAGKITGEIPVFEYSLAADRIQDLEGIIEQMKASAQPDRGAAIAKGAHHGRS